MLFDRTASALSNTRIAPEPLPEDDPNVANRVSLPTDENLTEEERNAVFARGVSEKQAQAQVEQSEKERTVKAAQLQQEVERINGTNIPDDQKRFLIARKEQELGIPAQPPKQSAPQLYQAETSVSNPISELDRIMSETRKAGRNISPGQYIKRADEAFSKEQQAVEDGKQLGIKSAQAEAAFRRETAAELEADQQRNADMQAKRQERMEAEMSKLTTMQEDLRNSKVDPDNFWNKRGVGQNIGLAIAVALTTYGSFNHDPMAGMKMLDSMVERDMQAQRENIGNKRAGVGAQQEKVGMLRANFADARQAEAAERAMKYETIQMRLGELAAGTKSEEITNRATQMSAQIEQRKQQSIMQYQQAAAQATQQNLGLQADIAKVKIAAQSSGRDGAANEIPGLVQIANVDKKAVDVARRTYSAKLNVQQKTDRLIELRKEYGWEAGVTPASRERVNEMKELSRALIIDLKEMKGMGANFTESEQKLLTDQLPEDPSRMGFVLERLIRLRERSESEAANILRTNGFVEANGASQPDQHGAIR